jgi:hypothetical protein
LKGLFFYCITALWLLPLPAALAAPARVHLTWQHPPGSTCPPQAVLEQDVEQALGRAIFTSAQAAQLQILGTVEDAASGVVVRLRAQRIDGKLLGMRELRAQSGQCAALRTDISLVLTLLVENNSVVTPESESPAPEFKLGLWTGLLVNVLPRATFGGGPAFALGLPGDVQLRADAAYWLPVAIQTAGGIRAEFQTASLALRVCPSIVGAADSVFGLRLCGGAQLATLFASQTEPAGFGTQVRVIAQGLAELRGALRLGSSARLELALGPLLALNRLTLYAVSNDGSRVLLYRPPILGMILSLGFII